jgi:alpha-glucuronidase
MTPEYLAKVKVLADVFRPYGIKLFLSVNFASPKLVGKLKTSDPLDPQVRAFWASKTKEIYAQIPDFGGFLVKANSEGEPGPQEFGRTHADGANMLAEAVKPFNGIVIWRAFVYAPNPKGDRFKEAYNDFKPLDGTFAKNVIVQVKNGPIDFQPREPFHPLFGAMPKTPLALEFQITQEYTGFSTNVFYQSILFKECLDSDTYQNGKGSTVAKVIDGSLGNDQITMMAGVANTGSDRNWTFIVASKLVCVRPIGLGSHLELRKNCGRVGEADVDPRRKSSENGFGYSDEIPRYLCEIHDTFRLAPRDGPRDSLGPGALARA